MEPTINQDAEVVISPNDHIGLVNKVAIDMANNDSLCRRRLGTDVGEYVGYGFMGLRAAAKNYKKHLGPWPNYAWKVIKDYITKAARRETIIKVSDNARYQAWRTMNGKSKTGCITEKCLDAAKAAVTQGVTLFHGGDPTPKTGVRDKTPDWEAKEAVEFGLRFLSPRHQYVLIHRFGLEGNDTKTLEEIGEMMGVTRERVRQIEARAMKYLRKKLG